MLNLDTHVLLYALEGKSTQHEKAALASDRWGISAIVLWEIAKLYQKRRIALSLEDPLMSSTLAEIHVWPLTREVCLNLGALDFASDPADELIAATSLTYRVPLLTRDAKIRSSRVVQFA